MKKRSLELVCCCLLFGYSFPLLGQTNLQTFAPGSQPLQKYRVLSIFPDYERANYGEPIAALSVHQKFQTFAGQAFDPSFALIAASVAAGQQFYNSSPHYGQGGGPFAQRFGAAYASLATGSLLSQAVMPVIFHQDPRYFRKSTSSIGSRFWYAVSRTVITRTDSGTSQFNYSQISAVAATTASTNLYYPSRDRTVSGNASSFVIGLGISTLWNLVREFGPERRD